MKTFTTLVALVLASCPAPTPAQDADAVARFLSDRTVGSEQRDRALEQVLVSRDRRVVRRLTDEVLAAIDENLRSALHARERSEIARLQQYVQRAKRWEANARRAYEAERNRFVRSFEAARRDQREALMRRLAASWAERRSAHEATLARNQDDVTRARSHIQRLRAVVNAPPGPSGVGAAAPPRPPTAEPAPRPAPRPEGPEPNIDLDEALEIFRRDAAPKAPVAAGKDG